MAKILMTRQMPGKAFEQLKAEHEVEIYQVDQCDKIPREDLLRLAAGKDAIISNLTEKMDREVFDAAGEQLKIVANYAVGFDNIDWKEAKNRGIFATNTPSGLGDAVAEFTVSLMLALARQVVPADKFARAGKYKVFDPTIFLGLDLTGKTIGIIGPGTIGSVAAKRAQAVFDMKIIYTGRHPNTGFEEETGAEFRQLNDLCREADVISMHVPLTEETRHMIGEEQFGLMKPTTIIINTARGPVIDENALADALGQRRIWGAALDVFEEEIPAEREHLDTRDWMVLTSHDNVILTPHIASATIEAREEMAQMAVENVLAALNRQEPKYLVPGYKEG